jgi:hypothetical protein
MTQAAIPLLTNPISLIDVDVLLYQLTLAVNASGIGSAPIATPPQPLPGGLQASLNTFALAVNAVTAANTVSLLDGPVDSGNILPLLNTMILEINAFNGGGSSYTAKAVHFDGAAILTRNSLIATDTNILSVAGWFKDIDTSGGPAAVWVSDPDNTYDAFSAVRDAGFAGEQEINAIEIGNLSITNPPFHMAGNWHLVVASAESNNAAPQPSAIFIDGVDKSSGITFGSGFDTFIMNTLKFVFGGDPTASNTIGDFADWRIDTRTWLTNGTIAPATLALFRDPGTGKPIDPAVATDALGDPMILFSGDATGFPVNQGTGGAFTLTGSLTNASTSPSD